MTVLLVSLHVLAWFRERWRFALWMLRGHSFRSMQCVVCRICAFDNVLRLGHFCSRSMGDQQKLIGRENVRTVNGPDRTCESVI
jgi:hypothetical protein